MKYSIISNPIPGPIKAAMSSLLSRGALVVDAYPDDQGHHLTVCKGTLRAHVTLVLDWYADGIDWADGDLSWKVNDGTEELSLGRWSDVCRMFEEKAIQDARWGGPPLPLDQNEGT